MLALRTGRLVAPHLETDLQRLLEPLVAFSHRREGHAEGVVLALVPCGADAELRAPARQHVERRHDLREEAGVAVGHAGDEHARVIRAFLPAAKPSVV